MDLLVVASLLPRAVLSGNTKAGAAGRWRWEIAGINDYFLNSSFTGRKSYFFISRCVQVYVSTLNIGSSPAKFCSCVARYFISRVQGNIILSFSVKQSPLHHNFSVKLPDNQHAYYVSRSFFIAAIKGFNLKVKIVRLKYSPQILFNYMNLILSFKIIYQCVMVTLQCLIFRG